MHRLACPAILLLAFAAGCVDKGPGATHKEIDPAYIEKNRLPAPPAAMTRSLGSDFGGKVVYLGADFESETIVPGEPFTIVHYWKVIEPPGAEWRVFTHVEGTAGKDWMNVDYTDMRQGYGPEKWQAGDIIRDENKFRLKQQWSAPFAKVVVGLFRRGGRVIEDRMDIVAGPKDKDRRVLAAQLEVERRKSRSTTAAPYVIRKASSAITIDGRADEAAWKSAPMSPAFTTAEGSPAIEGETRARLLWDDNNLYVFVSGRDRDVFSQYTKHDDSLWKEDVVEIFIDADRNRRGYVELQVNPNNAQFDAWFATSRAGKSDVAWRANMTSAVVVNGTAQNRDDTDIGWDVEIAIPLAAVKGGDEAMKVDLPPRLGDGWRLNIVRIDLPKGKKSPAVASWNQITYQDFHALGRMLEVKFADQTGKTTAPPAKKPADPPAGTVTKDEKPASPASAPAGSGGSGPGAKQPK